ncbi:hypothetical protein SAMN05421736_12341 [Evansella caseinilytica]|uniref:Calcineurin-like phosphoesterase domain-containing protein n=1 Tax=Evansella caseinilytica TaxID=1503961 RepID=A0A1H3ULW0_9BACI|nr:metallophosphoesterase [Evansella caseinilytica]SDZ63394.1 hypothetical protein SAMN05421736_12341 [Evansella caseinilytica]
MIVLYLSAIVAVLLYYLFYRAYRNTHEVQINTVTLQDTKGTPLTGSTMLRVLQLSDLHLEHLSVTPDKLYESLKDQRFDLIALTGDFLDRPKSIPKLVPYLKVLQQLEPEYGTFAVFGNHDYKLRVRSFRQLQQVLSAFQVKMLQNEHVTIDAAGKIVHVIGIDDHHSKKNDVESAYRGLPENGYSLVLTHDPNVVMEMEDKHFDYMLTGHFHGGQICWPKPYHLMKFGKLVRLNLIKGLIHYNGKAVYINEGLGQTGVNIRVGSRPEITIHELMLSSEAAAGVQPEALLEEAI